MTFHVSNLPLEISEPDLRKAFAAHGSVASVSIPRERMRRGRSSGAHRGYGFVVMNDPDEARKALAALDRHALGGSELSVREAIPPRRPVYVH